MVYAYRVILRRGCRNGIKESGVRVFGGMELLCRALHEDTYVIASSRRVCEQMVALVVIIADNCMGHKPNRCHLYDSSSLSPDTVCLQVK